MTGGGAGDEELIAELWREVRPNQLDLAAGLVQDLSRTQDDADDAEAWARVRSAAHRLAGTLGSYLQQPAGDLAVELDRLVAGVEQPSDDVRRRAATLAAALHEAMQREADAQA